MPLPWTWMRTVPLILAPSAGACDTAAAKRGEVPADAELEFAEDEEELAEEVAAAPVVLVLVPVEVLVGAEPAGWLLPEGPGLDRPVLLATAGPSPAPPPPHAASNMHIAMPSSFFEIGDITCF